LPKTIARGILYASMNIEFHYYALHYISRCAGFPELEASILSGSSQLVDECTAPWEIRGKSRTTLTQVTQNYVFWDEGVAENIYRPFHFMPGDQGLASSRRRDGKSGRLTTTEDSPLAREVLIAALKSRDLFRIGIALHVYADTWAHQNFSGDSEPQNALEPGSLLPAVGHLQALKNPDNPRLVWTDPRLNEEHRMVDNAVRFSRAATMIYRFLCTYNGRGFIDAPLIVGKLEELWTHRGSSGDSAASASDYIVELDVPPYERNAWAMRAGGAAGGPFQASADPYRTGYDRLAWLRNTASKATSAFGAPKGAIPESGYRDSLFERWNRAAAEHRNFCRRIFTQRGIS
jgi:hypothetical protein